MPRKFDLLDTKDVSELLSVSPSRVSRLVTAGKLVPVYQLRGTRGGFLFDRKQVERYAENRIPRKTPAA